MCGSSLDHYHGGLEPESGLRLPAVPTGTVYFYAGTYLIGSGPVDGNGVASLTIGLLPAGIYDISAAYGGRCQTLCG